MLCAVVLTSPVLAMATYTASEPPTCATNVDAVWTKGYFLTIIRNILVKFINLKVLKNAVIFIADQCPLHT